MCQASEKGPHRHEETAHGDEPGPMQLGTKMADHGKEQQVAYMYRKKEEILKTISNAAKQKKR